MSPPIRRRHPYQRTLRIALRTLHIASACIVLGAAFFQQEAGSWISLLVYSGVAIVANDLFRYGADYLRYVQFWAIVAKMAVVLLAVAMPALLLPAMFTALVIGSIISHAPGALRHYPLWGQPGPCADRVSSPCGNQDSATGELQPVLLCPSEVHIASDTTQRNPTLPPWEPF